LQSNHTLAQEMTAGELYRLYSAWTGQIHFYCNKHLGRHLDCEYFPNEYEIRMYSGWPIADQAASVPKMIHIDGKVGMVKLLTPAENPTAEDLEDLFRTLCYTAAQVLEIELFTPRALTDYDGGRLEENAGEEPPALDR
jgi:hypothetical protein